MSFLREIFAVDGGTSDTQNPRLWLTNWAGGPMSKAGVAVSDETALALAAHFACKRVVSEDLALLPAKVFEDSPDGKQAAPDHPVYKLIHDEPNPLMTPMAFFGAVQANAMGGNGYAEIVRKKNAARTPAELWPIHPSRVTGQVQENGKWFYKVKIDPTRENGNTDTVLIAFDSMLHIKGLGSDGMIGWDVANVQKEVLGGAIASDQFSHAFYGNGLHVGSVISHPETLSDTAIQHMRESYNALYQGADKTGTPLILEEGTTWQRMTISPNEAQFLESRQWSVEEVARIHRVSPMMIGHNQNVPFASIEQLYRQHYRSAILPWTRKWCQEINKKLLGVESEFFCEFVFHAVLEADAQAQAQYMTTMTNGGLMRPAEGRALLNLPTDSSPAAKSLWMQGAMRPIDDLFNVGSEETSGTSGTASIAMGAEDNTSRFNLSANGCVAVFEAAAAVVCRKEFNALKDAFRRYEGNPEGFTTKVVDFYHGQRKYIEQAFTAPAETVARQGAAILGINALESVQEDVSVRARDYTRDALAAACRAFREGSGTDFINGLDNQDTDTIGAEMLQAVINTITKEQL